MRLTGKEYDELSGALLDAFADRDTFELMLRTKAGWQLDAIAGPGSLATVIGDVIDYAESRDAVDELVAGARAANPGNERLLRLAAARGLEQGEVP